MVEFNSVHLKDSYDIADLSYGDLLDAIGQAIPDRIAIVYGDTRLTWKAFDERSNRLARHLSGRGLKPDSKVAFYLHNHPAYLELMSACFKGRFVHANVNYRYTDDELLHLLNNSDAEAVVYQSQYRPHVAVLRPKLDQVKVWLEVGDEALPEYAESFESACIEGDGSPLGIKRSGDDLYFMYTGGTTGYPKGVMWRHKDRIAVVGMSESGDAAAHAQSVADNPVIPVALPAAPLMHSTGFTHAISCMMSGGTMVLLPGNHFDAEVCLAEIVRNGVDRMAIVGDAFSVPLLACLRENSDRYDLSRVQLIMSAGAMWSEPRKRALLEYFRNAALSDSLGSSEGSRLGASLLRRGESNKTASFQLGPDVKVFTQDFREVEPGSGEPGMIAKAGPLPLGYYGDPEATAKTFPVINGVRYSMAGDWCTVEADGTMTLLGRGNNCINTGGEKVYPEEVEEALKKIPGIEDAAVIGVQDERWGQAVTALIRPDAETTFDEGEVKAYLAEHLARYKHPKRFDTTEVDFRHANGKINYRLVTSMIEENEAAASSS